MEIKINAWLVYEINKDFNETQILKNKTDLCRDMKLGVIVLN